MKGSVRAIVGSIVVAAVVVTLVTATGPTKPHLFIDGSVADDFGEPATDTWERFVAAFPSEGGCIGDVQLVAVYGLEERAQ